MIEKKSAAIFKRLGAILLSIRFRLVMWFVAILALVLADLSIFVFFIQSRDVHNDVLTHLESREALLLARRPFGAVLVPDNFVQVDETLAITDASGNILTNQGLSMSQDFVRGALRGWQARPQTGNEAINFAIMTAALPESHTTYLFMVAPFVDHFTVLGFTILGTPLDPGGRLHALLLTLLFGSLLTMAIALVGGFWLADRAMRPVHTITQTARAIGETDLSRRLNMKSRDELGELANTFDGMLGRLQAAFERQRQFVADASHELRTPLTIVNLETSRALASPRKTEDYRHALSVIQDENDFMTALVNDLLTLARMDAGQATMEKLPVDLSDVALETIERLTPLAARKGVRLEAGELPEARILGDHQHLIQMVSNLVDNGIKYTAGDDRKVFIETGTSSGTAWVQISDNGPGIAPEHLPHLFDRFYRVDQARNHAGDRQADPQSPSGSGLGLSIVQSIVTSHGGEIKVESQVGSGTTFTIRFQTA